ncbi:hypothetical protein PSH03_003833 [Micromonospora sp. PSH03]|uniref:hypothetical protein n=1 Tax=Micromonospora TaxID=1873 RepID=UPI001EE7E5C2|nr:hypothetical protein [Micromonospora salmantinae]MCG5454670.1 hypothetical protein [Micromonospora salmantinae]
MELTVDTMQMGATTRIRLVGEMDLGTSGIVHDAVIAALTSDSVRDIILDFADLTAPVVRRQLFAAGLLGLLCTEAED